MIIVIAANWAAPEIGDMNEPTDPVDEPENQHDSTYGLLIRSEEKGRNVLEMVIYPLLIIGAIVAIWQFVVQPMESPVHEYERRFGIPGHAANICGVRIGLPKPTLDRAIVSPLAEI
jgi:hypothetical protein